jgi:dTDP-4-amino-4,6-dideoxy-D-galactose acyltransferase
MSANSICEYLEWDSGFFGRRIARASISSLTKESLVEIDAWCGLHRIDCLYFLASSSDRCTAKLAEENMFRFVDVKTTLDLQVEKFRGGNPQGSVIRTAAENDISALRALARSGHRDSRFYYDGNFPEALCDELYATWIEKSCRGWARNVFVAEEGGAIEGYLTCHLSSSECGQIGLVGVAEKAQGKGIGTQLVSSAVRWFSQQGTNNISVVTQGRNVRAQRLYQKCGFATRSVELWFHRWFPEKGEPQ